MSIINLQISALTHDGRGIGFLPGNGGRRPVFVAGALPGQTVSCRLRNTSRSFFEADLAGILEAAPDQQKPHCPHWNICGGCSLQLLPYQKQLFWKGRILEEALRRIGKIPAEALKSILTPPIASPATENFRNKAEFAFGLTHDNRPALGFRRQSSHEVFNIESCAIISEEAARTAKIFREIAFAMNCPDSGEKNSFWKFLVLRQSSTNGGKWLAICITGKGNAQMRKMVAMAGKKLLQALPFLQSFIHEEKYGNNLLAKGQKRILILGNEEANKNGAAIFQRKIAGSSFSLDASNFFQVNGPASEILAQIALRMAGQGENLLDLYCGVGAPGLLISKNFSHTTAIEIDARAIHFARLNAKDLGLTNYQAYSGDVGKCLSRIAKKRWHAALADPPRQGLDKNALKELVGHNPDKIVYISCNPATLARDAAILNNNGYWPEQMASVDMFPHTPHLECIGLWIKTGHKIS